MNVDSEIVVVSGLPRTGTSLMMQMLQAGGVKLVTDQVRAADGDNPRGYFELEAVKQIEKDKSWLPRARGRAFKMVSQLLYHLPATEQYRIVFMQRNLDEVLVSQEKMLRHRNATGVAREQMKEAFTLHLEQLFQWLHEQPNMKLLVVNYNDLLDHPRRHAEKINAFLHRTLTVKAMVDTVDPDLYRNRQTTTDV